MHSYSEVRILILNIKAKNIKFLEENKSVTPKIQMTKGKNMSIGFINASKEATKKMERQPSE
jgi:hypothetical protein